MIQADITLFLLVLIEKQAYDPLTQFCKHFKHYVRLSMFFFDEKKRKDLLTQLRKYFIHKTVASPLPSQ